MRFRIWKRSSKLPVVLIANDLCHIATRHSRRGHTTAWLYPFPRQVEVLETRQGLAHAHDQGLGGGLPSHKAAMPVAGVVLKSRRRGYIAHPHLLFLSRKNL